MFFEARRMMIPQFKSKDMANKLWWLHDSYWHAEAVKVLGPSRAGRINLEVTEKIFRKLTTMLLREKVIARPRSILELMFVFKVVWKNAFFDDLYINEPITYEGNTALWTGTACHAYDSLKRAGMLEGYACGCQAVRNGVTKSLHIKPLHKIRESLVKGDGRCVIQITFCP